MLVDGDEELRENIKMDAGRRCQEMQAVDELRKGKANSTKIDRNLIRKPTQWSEISQHEALNKLLTLFGQLGA